MYDFLRIAERMLATPSASEEGTGDLVRLLCQTVIPALPGQHSVLAEADGRNANLLVVAGGANGHGGRAVLLDAHLDTVPPGDRRAWTATGGNPYRPRREGDRLIGLGSADAKLDWLCKAEALRRVFAEQAGGPPVYLLGTWGEERGLRGARSFLAQRLLPATAVALVGEPTACRLVTRHKGLIVAELRLVAESRRVGQQGLSVRRRRYKGRAAHSATPDAGESAILNGLAEIADETPVLAIRGGDEPSRVAAWCDVDIASTRHRRAAEGPLVVDDDGAEIQPMSPALFAGAREFALGLRRLAAEDGGADAAFSPPRLTTNIGRIEGRGDTLIVTFDLRFLPGCDRAQLLRRVEAMVTSIAEMYAGLRTTLTVERDDPPLAEAPSAVVRSALAAMTAAGLAPTTATDAGCSEAGLYARSGIPALVFGAGCATGNVHAPNEWTSVTQLEQAVAFYVAFLRQHRGG
jgi:succinyl-diaminopimelate desuccinylase